MLSNKIFSSWFGYIVYIIYYSHIFNLLAEFRLYHCLNKVINQSLYLRNVMSIKLALATSSPLSTQAVRNHFLKGRTIRRSVLMVSTQNNCQAQHSQVKNMNWFRLCIVYSIENIIDIFVYSTTYSIIIIFYSEGKWSIITR